MTDYRPYQLTADELTRHMDEMVSNTFADLTSQFLLLPRGESFVAYPEFQAGYEALRMETGGFTILDVGRCWKAVENNALSFVVLRTILGVTPPEWVDLAKEDSDADLTQAWARGLDKAARTNPNHFNTSKGKTKLTRERTAALFAAACNVIGNGAEEAPEGLIHRLEKIDTQEGLESVRYVSQNHIPYAVLLYERYLGRPFASHRDSVSELVGDVMESAIETQLSVAQVPFRKTKRAERVPGFEQAPDFFIPDELSPSVIIEAKITGDDGTARDKVSRILRLASMRDERLRAGKPSFEVVACIDGRGFGIRRQDMVDLLTATYGKVFTASRLDDLIDNTELHNFRPAL